MTALVPRKTCTRCNVAKTLRYFPPTGKRCKQCISEVRHGAQIMRDFGVTAEFYAGLLAFQGGRCAICGNKPGAKRLAIDHNHQTGAVRGLLCKNCNYRILGGVRDSVETLKRAISYLEDPPAGRWQLNTGADLMAGIVHE